MRVCMSMIILRGGCAREERDIWLVLVFGLFRCEDAQTCIISNYLLSCQQRRREVFTNVELAQERAAV
jgi:hypothetical protein